MSGTIIPMKFDFPVFRLRAIASGWESRAAIAFSTRAFRSGLTNKFPFTTAETVEVDTPASLATSRIVHFGRVIMVLSSQRLQSGGQTPEWFRPLYRSQTDC